MESKGTLMTPRDMALQLGIRLDYAYGLIWAGRIAAKKVNGRWLIPTEAVEAHAKRREMRFAA